MRRRTGLLGLLLLLALALGGCSEQEKQWQADAERELDNLAALAWFAAAPLGALLAFRAARKPKGDPAASSEPWRIAVAAATRLGGAVSLLTAAFLWAVIAAQVIFPRDFVTSEPRDSPDPGGLFLVLVYAGPFMVLFLILGMWLTRVGARRLHPFGEARLQEAIVAIATLGAMGLMLLPRGPQ